MDITFTGLCSGTTKKRSNRSGNDYTVTNFVDLSNMQAFSVFGDLGLVADMTPRKYTLVGVASKMFNAEAAFADPVSPASAPAPISSSSAK